MESSKLRCLFMRLLFRHFNFQTLYNSLKQLLDYCEPDLEEVFMQTFRISYRDVFDAIIHHDLKDNGDNINVTIDNKRVSY